MKIDIVTVYIPRYKEGHEFDFVPSITAIHLAALTPAPHRVRVIYQQVQPVDLDTDAEVVALSFFTGFAPEAFRLAAEFRKRGKIVIAGGPHATFCPDGTREHFDAIVTGEAESVWSQVLLDLEKGELKPAYSGGASPMAGIPTPRYDLLPPSFVVPRVVQATRGCPFACSFCSVPALNPGYRMRPVAEVLRDIRYEGFRHWWQRKVVWFWDDNLTIDRVYIKELLTAMVPLKRWWLTQASMDISGDPALLHFMRRSGCIGIFFGIESFGDKSLEDANKRQNRVAHYKVAVDALHKKGICVMAGIIAGFDGDTPESIRDMARQLHGIGGDVPFLSILTPYQGTPLYERLKSEGRIIDERGWEFYNGYNVAFYPKRMSPQELLNAHRALWKEAFSFKYVILRTSRALTYLRWGAFLMCACMNLFYGLKAWRGNTPVDMSDSLRR